MKRRRTKRSAPRDAAAEVASGSNVQLTNGPAPRQGRRHLRGRRGCLKDLPEMPLDILYLVFSELKPMDLLNLGRTDKAFRSLLFNRSSIPLWKAARRNIEGLPDCPSFMSEPSFANLVFGAHCHVCLRPNIRTIYWEFRARYCGSCKPTATSSVWNLDRTSLPPGCLSTPLLCMFIENPRRSLDRSVSLADVDAIKRKWLATPADGREEFTQEHGALVKQIREFASECKKWHSAKKEARYDELEEIRRVRLETIVNKLRALGWDEELDIMAPNDYWPFSRHPLVRQSKPLTENVWRAIEDKITAAIEQTKRDRLRDERMDVMRTRFYGLKGTLSTFRNETRGGFFPNIRDIASCAEIREIIDVPNNIDVTLESLEALRPLVPGIVDRWKDEATSVLMKLVRETCGIPDDTDVMALAICLAFKCQLCEELVSYPSVFSHWCYGRMEGTIEDYDESDEYNCFADALLFSFRWNISTVSILHGTLNIILAACGKDATRATIKEMDELDPRLVCNTCSGVELRSIMTWRAAVRHDWTIHSGTQESLRWRQATEKEIAVIRSLSLDKASQIATRKRLEVTYWWCCARCPTLKRSQKSNILEHIRNRHNVESPSEEDLLCNPPYEDASLRPVYLISNKSVQLELTSGVTQAVLDGEAAFCDFALISP